MDNFYFITVEITNVKNAERIIENIKKNLSSPIVIIIYTILENLSYIIEFRNATLKQVELIVIKHYRCTLEEHFDKSKYNEMILSKIQS